MICDAAIETGTPGGYPYWCYVEDADGWRLPLTRWVNTETGEVIHYGTWTSNGFKIPASGGPLKTFRETFKAPLRLAPRTESTA